VKQPVQKSGGKTDPDAAETLPLSLSKKQFEIALRYHGLDSF
jgi:hypothetical protein